MEKKSNEFKSSARVHTHTFQCIFRIYRKCIFNESFLSLSLSLIFSLASNAFHITIVAHLYKLANKRTNDQKNNRSQAPSRAHNYTHRKWVCLLYLFNRLAIEIKVNSWVFRLNSLSKFALEIFSFEFGLFYLARLSISFKVKLEESNIKLTNILCNIHSIPRSSWVYFLSPLSNTRIIDKEKYKIKLCQSFRLRQLMWSRNRAALPSNRSIKMKFKNKRYKKIIITHLSHKSACSKYIDTNCVN